MADTKLANTNLVPPVNAGKTAITDDKLFEIIELLFFAYRDFVSDPDEILTQYQFGRAHHRVLHFVNRNPGLRISELLDILKITKQSLGRVLRQLIEDGFVEQREGSSDRRQRLLFLTDAGSDLAQRLAEPQLRRIAGALKSAGPGNAALARDFLYSLVNDQEHTKVRAIIEK
ncbi:MAG: MarR family transcriptional regulator [Rhizobiales bacterium]|nr:MarR family transcriptional regulator [Hyphomicrobiales bacterium]